MSWFFFNFFGVFIATKRKWTVYELLTGLSADPSFWRAPAKTTRDSWFSSAPANFQFSKASAPNSCLKAITLKALVERAIKFFWPKIFVIKNRWPLSVTVIFIAISYEHVSLNFWRVFAFTVEPATLKTKRSCSTLRNTAVKIVSWNAYQFKWNLRVTVCRFTCHVSIITIKY